MKMRPPGLRRRLLRLAPVFLLFVLSPPPAAAAAGNGLRVISLYAAHTEVLLRLGARDNIIGVSRQETYADTEDGEWRPETYSFQDDVEKFLAAKPDVVLIRPQHAAGGARMKVALERAGVNVIAIQAATAAALHDYWRELAGLVGREAEAERMIAGFEADIARYRRASAARRGKPGVFIEAIHREVKTFTPDSIPMWLVELAGGYNVAADARPASPGVIIAEYGPERLLAKAAEVDVFISQEGAMNRTPLSAVKERGLYRPLAAFKTGRVHKIPEALLARPTPSLLVGLRMLAEWTGLEVEE